MYEETESQDARARIDRRQFLGLTTGILVTEAIACVSRNESRMPDDAGKPLNAAAFHATRQFVDTRFGKIAYVARGAGDTALFLHGFPLNSFQWRGALDRLKTHRRCIAPDFMAMGHTIVADGQSV